MTRPMPNRVWIGLVAAATLAPCLQPLLAQDAPAAKPVQPAPPDEQGRPAVTYKIELVVTEVEDGKRTNSRNYMLLARQRDLAKLRAGNRVPVRTGSESYSYQYQDVGMSIDARISSDDGNRALLDLTAAMSDAVKPQDANTIYGPPILRDNRSTTSGEVSLGKPTLVATMDDVTSNRRFEIQVTVTKVK